MGGGNGFGVRMRSRFVVRMRATRSMYVLPVNGRNLAAAGSEAGRHQRLDAQP